MDEEQVLAEYLGYVGDVDGVDYTARYVYRETTVEVLADALRLVTYDEPRDRDETVKALAILKTHGWRRDVLPFSFRRRLVPWNALAEAQIMPQQGDSRYGRLRLAYARHHTLDRVMHRPIEIYFLRQDQARFEALCRTARDMIATHRAGPWQTSGEPQASEIAGGGDLPGAIDLEALERLAALHDRGVLNDEEFAATKARLLG